MSAFYSLLERKTQPGLLIIALDIRVNAEKL